MEDKTFFFENSEDLVRLMEAMDEGRGQQSGGRDA
jgi:hypothetical protein